MFIRHSFSAIAKSQIGHRFRHGIPDEEMLSPFEASTTPVYCITVLFMLSLAIAFGVTDFSLDAKGLRFPVLLFGGLAAIGWVIRRYGHTRIAAATEAVGILGFFSLLCTFALAMLSATNMPLVDETLIAADAMLGFSWIAMMRHMEAMPQLVTILAYSYKSIQWQPITLIIMLSVLKREKDIWIFINGWAISLLITVLIFPFFPAVAAINYHGLSAYPGIHSADFVDGMMRLRDGTLRLINKSSVTGTVTFPSFHATSAILLAWGFRVIAYARWPAALLNAMMLFGTLVVGGHYLVDLAGGVIIAAFSIATSTYLTGRISFRSSNKSDCKPQFKRPTI